MRQQRRDVEQFLERVGTNDAGLPEERVDDRVARRQRAGVRRSRARASLRSARLDRHDRLEPRDPARNLGELARVPEALEIQQDDVGAGILRPVLNEIVARDISLVADGHERREADVQLPRVVENRDPQRAALRRKRDAAWPRR